MNTGEEIALESMTALWLTRHWVAARQTGRPLPSHVLRILTRHGYAEGDLNQCMLTLCAGAARRLLILPPCTPGISADERSLLHAWEARAVGDAAGQQAYLQPLFCGARVHEALLRLAAMGALSRAHVARPESPGTTGSSEK